jgi:P-type E1-E2 ATPase
MIELIALISWLLGKYIDLWIALALLIVNAVLGFLQEQRASAAVKALRRRLQVTARVLRDGEWRSCAARDLVAGDIIRVRSGDFVPADVKVVDGDLQVDQSVLTGESREIGKSTGDTLYSGSVVREGEASGVVTATGARTFFGHTTELVESAHPKLHVEQVITRVVKWLFLIVGILVGTAIVVSAAEGFGLIEILPLTGALDERRTGRSPGDVHRQHGGRLGRIGAQGRSGHAIERSRRRDKRMFSVPIEQAL